MNINKTVKNTQKVSYEAFFLLNFEHLLREHKL